MPISINADAEVEQYRVHLDSLYSMIEQAMSSKQPKAAFHRNPVALDEEQVGPYKVESLEISAPGMTAVRLLPRGIFIIGARGRVDVRSRIGREVLVWVEQGGPALRIEVDEGARTIEQATRPLYPNVPEGWAWADERRNQLLPLTDAVFVDSVLTRLTE